MPLQSSYSTRRTTLRHVMLPVLQATHDRMVEAEQLHEPCRQEIARLRVGAIDPREMPADVPMVYLPKADVKVRRLYVTTLQITHVTTSALQQFRAADGYLPKPVPMGIAWGKPYVGLTPIPGLTPANWQAHFPPFHYWRENMNICVGQRFAVGEATDAEAQLGALAEVLSWANFADPLNTMPTIVDKYGQQNPLWAKWASALDAIATGKSQDVFIPIKMLKV